MMIAIPDESMAITQAKKRYKYESLEALKREVLVTFLLDLFDLSLLKLFRF